MDYTATFQESDTGNFNITLMNLQYFMNTDRHPVTLLFLFCDKLAIN